MSTKRAAPRSAKGGLSRDRVIEAAREQVEADGLGSLSSRTVAARLEVTPMALYRHVADMDEILSAVVDELLAEIGTPSDDLDWQSWLEDLANSLRSMFRRHPDALALFNRRPVTSPAARRRLEAAVEVLGRAGFGEDDAARAYAAVHTYTIGFSALDAGRRRAPTPSAPLDAPDDPVSARIRGFVTEDQFLHGLRALIAGIDRSSQPS